MALTLLNDPTFVEAARVFAARIGKEGGATTNTKIDFAYEWVLSRKPSRFERATLRKMLESSRKRYKLDPDAAKELLAVGHAPSGENVELAAWTNVASIILSLDESLTKG